MKFFMTCGVILAIWATAPRLATVPHDRAQETASCILVGQALTDYAHIKPGATRSEVEKYFAQDGGAQFPGNTRYVYPKCRYLHVDVQFSAAASSNQIFSADDMVTKASKLYVDYSAKD